MRGLSVLLLVGCTETGAHLTFSAPEGPGAATSFRVVLASHEAIPSVGNQRVSPGALMTQVVSYYYQRTIAGGTSGMIDDVDGFAVRIEPDPSTDESQFIPFVLMYEGEKIAGVGTFHATDRGLPSPILVLRDEIDKYVLDIEPAVEVTDMDEAATGQVRVVECYHDDQTMFTSGIVWRPRAGGEFRLLFPADGGLDATDRMLDLDCDGHAVTVESSSSDCDDSRGGYHRDAIETCDGYDTNCDGLQSLVVACTGSGANVCLDPVSNTGFALCDDRTGEEGVCQSDPQCACAANPSGCPHCLIATQDGASTGMVKPCQPSIGYVPLLDYGCAEATPCTVQVLSVGGGWKAEVAADSTAPVFGIKATVGPKVMLRVKRPEGPVADIPGVKGTSTGDVGLGIVTSDGVAHLRTMDLQLDTEPATCQGTGPFAMLCN